MKKERERKGKKKEKKILFFYFALGEVILIFFFLPETSMGTCINSQINKTESDYVKAIFRIGQIIVKRIFSPHLYADYLFNLSSLGRENSKLLKILHETTTNVNK